MTATGLPFDDIRDLLRLMPEASPGAVAAVRARDAELTKPPGSLGRLEEIVEFLAAWQDKATPVIERPLVAIFAANHGVVAKGVSAFPPSVTRSMMENFAAGSKGENDWKGSYMA